MVKINKSGFTLIELIIYVSILSLIFMSMIYSFIYFQKIIQNNNQNYFIRIQIYRQLNIIQQYLLNNRALLKDNILIVLDKNDNQIYILDTTNNKIRNIYPSKGYDLSILENTNFESIKTEYLLNHRIIKYEFLWKDMFKKEQILKEYFIVINQKM